MENAGSSTGLSSRPRVVRYLVYLVIWLFLCAVYVFVIRLVYSAMYGSDVLGHSIAINIFGAIVWLGIMVLIPFCMRVFFHRKQLALKKK
jgi:hypothetical protein